MAFRISKNRGTVWTEPFPDDKEVQFQIKPLTPLLNEQINNRFISAQLIHSDGKNSVETSIKSFGIAREQAKAIVVGWRGITGDASMGPLADKPMPFETKYVDLLFDEWDEGGVLAGFIMKQANQFNDLREAQLGNYEPPSDSA